MVNFNDKSGKLTGKIIGIAMEVHNILGPGFVESIYHNAMKKMFSLHQIPFETEKEIKIFLMGEVIGIHRIDLLVNEKIVVELKAVDEISKIHISQIISYLKASGLDVGLILNVSQTRVQIRRIKLNESLKNTF